MSSHIRNLGTVHVRLTCAVTSGYTFQYCLPCCYFQDTAGAERYEAMSKLYYRGAKAAVICFGEVLNRNVCVLFVSRDRDFVDLTDSSNFERAQFWVNELKTHEEVGII